MNKSLLLLLNIKIAFLILFTFLFSSLSSATDYYVNDNSLVGDVFCTNVGNIGNSGLTAASPKATFTQIWNTYGPSGTNVLTSGDVIYVDAGTYLATDNNLALSVDGISIIGAGMELTFFDNNQTSSDANRWATITSTNISISNIYITGYNYGLGDANAIQITGATNLTFTNVMINENNPGGGSSSIVINGGSSVNFIGGGSSCNPGSASVAGGGVNIEGNGNVVSFTNYTLSANEKDYQGGSGLYIIGDNTTSVSITNSIFSDNINGSGDGGGAIFIANGAQLTISGSCFNNNSSSQVSSVNYGGAISVGRGSTVTISDCSFSGNGGAISINIGLGSTGTTATVNLSECSFTGNSAVDGADILGRVSFSRAAVFNVNDCTWSGTSEDVTNDNSASMTLIFSGSPTTSGSVSFDGLAVRATPTLACPSVPTPCFSLLPVEFLDFVVECIHNNTQFNWSTATERNNDYFTIEYSNDFINWNQVLREKGKGTTQYKSDYSVELENAQSGYYKLSQIDTDGKVNELKTTFFRNCTKGFRVYPNPTQDELTISLEGYDENVIIQVFNAVGVLVYEKEIRVESELYSYKMNLRDLENGAYFIRAIDGQNNSQQTIVKY